MGVFSNLCSYPWLYSNSGFFSNPLPPTPHPRPPTPVCSGWQLHSAWISWATWIFLAACLLLLLSLSATNRHIQPPAPQKGSGKCHCPRPNPHRAQGVPQQSRWSGLGITDAFLGLQCHLLSPPPCAGNPVLAPWAHTGETRQGEIPVSASPSS